MSKCLNPSHKSYVNKINGKIYSVEIRCRKCIPCKKAEALMWAQRIEFELTGKNACFVTLTYNDENLEEISKREVQLFMKRLRKHLKNENLKYFACGEHGELSERPHYHLIIIGWQPDISKDVYKAGWENGKVKWASKTIEKCWKKGFNTVGSATKESIFYTTGYVIKDDNGFRLMSKNMGKEQIMKNKEVYKKRFEEGNVKLNRIFKSYLLDDMEKLIDQNEQLENWYVEMNEKYPEEEFENVLKKEAAEEKDKRYYREKVSNAKQEIFRRKKL